MTEVDKVLQIHLEVKEFTVEPSTLITVQHLIRWTATFILKLLVNLPEWRSSPQRGNMVRPRSPLYFNPLIVDANRFWWCPQLTARINNEKERWVVSDDDV